MRKHKIKMVEDNVLCDDTREEVLCIDDSSSSSRTHYRQVKSEAWELFMKKDKLALCKVCNKEYAYHKGTSNLRDHFIMFTLLNYSPHKTSLFWILIYHISNAWIPILRE